MPEQQSTILQCANCQKPLAGKYCHHCGQKSHHEADYSIAHFARQAMEELLNFDNKLFRTLLPLLFRPGYLTRKFFEGEQQRYVRPVGLFIFINFLFFILKTDGLFRYEFSNFLHDGFSNMARFANQKLTESGLPEEVFEAKFNTAMQYQQESFLILLVPLLAIGLQLLYIRSKKYFVEHLVFSLHFFSFFPFYLSALPVVLYGVITGLHKIGIRIEESEALLLAVVLPVCNLWLYKAIRHFYRESVVVSLVKSILLTFLVFLLIGLVYRSILFYAVLYSVS